MIYVVARNYDGVNIKEFDNEDSALEFIGAFLSSPNYGADVDVFSGKKLEIVAEEYAVRYRFK